MLFDLKKNAQKPLFLIEHSDQLSYRANTLLSFVFFLFCFGIYQVLTE